MEHYQPYEQETRLIHTQYRSLQKCFGCIHLRMGSAMACVIIAGLSFYFAVISFQNSSPFYSYMQQAPLLVFGVTNLFLGIVALLSIGAAYLDVYSYILVATHSLYITIGAVLADEFINAVLFIVYRRDYSEWCITSHYESFRPILPNITMTTTTSQTDFYNCDRAWQDELKFGLLAFFVLASFYIYSALCFRSYRMKNLIRLSLHLRMHANPQYQVPMMPPMVAPGAGVSGTTVGLPPEPMMMPPQGVPPPPMMRSDRPNVIVLHNGRPSQTKSSSDRHPPPPPYTMDHI